MIAVGADVADRERGVGRELVFDAERPGDQGGRLHVRLYAAGDELGARGDGGGGIDEQLGDGQRREAVDGIERSVLVGAVAERVLEVFVHAEAGAENGSWAERTPGYADARLWEKFCVVLCEQRCSDVRLGVDHAVGERVVGGAPVRLVPAVGSFIAKSKGDR